jgi:hypothetical protein
MVQQQRKIGPIFHIYIYNVVYRAGRPAVLSYSTQTRPLCNREVLWIDFFFPASSLSVEWPSLAAPHSCV